MIKSIKNFIFYICAQLLLSLPLTVFGETEITAKPTSMTAFSFMNLLNMVMGLVVVIALILGLAWVLKKYGRLPSQNMVDMKVLGGLSLGTREKAILIEVENTRLLVGVSPGHIQTLHILGSTQVDSTPRTSFDETLTKEVEKQND